MAGGLLRGPQRASLRGYPDFQTELLVFDVIVEIGSAREAKVTDHPVERGSEISDFVIPGPKTVTLRVVFTNTPNGDLNGGPYMPPNPAPPDEGRDLDLVQTLDALMVERRLVTLFTQDIPFGPCVIRSVAPKRSASLGQSTEVIIVLRQIVFVTAANVLLPGRRMATFAGDALRMDANGNAASQATPTPSTPNQVAAAVGANR